MRRRLSRRVARIAILLTLALLLCAGGLAAQHSGADVEALGSRDPGVVADHAALDGPHPPALVETSDSEETSPVGSEHLNALALGLFLVSLGLLIGAGLVGCNVERRLLELLRLPSVITPTPARIPLSALEVFRL